MIEKKFVIDIESKKPLQLEDINYSDFDFDDEYDTITSLFYSLSEFFYDLEILLIIEICDYNLINLGVELSILLENFYNFVDFANNNEKEDYSLLFYEQGAKRLLFFKKTQNGEYTLTFENNCAHDFKLLSTSGTLLDLNLMLFTIFSKVRFLSRKIWPSVSKSSVYRSWVDDINSAFDIIK